MFIPIQKAGFTRADGAWGHVSHCLSQNFQAFAWELSVCNLGLQYVQSVLGSNDPDKKKRCFYFFIFLQK